MAQKKRFLGKKARLYYNSGSYDTPTWVRIETRDTLSVTLTKSTEDVTAEDSDGEMQEQTILSQRSLEFEAFQADAEADNTVINALQAAYEADTPMEFAVAKGDIATTGVRIRRLPGFLVHECGEGFDVKGVSKVKIVAKPGPSENAPTTSVVA